MGLVLKKWRGGNAPTLLPRELEACRNLQIEYEKGLFEPSISLEETDEARGLLFCVGGHIVTLNGAIRITNYKTDQK